MVETTGSRKVGLRLPMTIVVTAATYRWRKVDLRLPMTIVVTAATYRWRKVDLRLPMTIVVTAATYSWPDDKQQHFSTSPWNRWDRPGAES